MAKAAEQIGILVSILTQLRHMVSMAFNRLGLFKSAEEAIYSGELQYSAATPNEDRDHVMMWDGSSPFVPVPIPIAKAFLRKRLPVVRFSDFMEAAADKLHEEEHDFDGTIKVDGKVRCSVCWDCMEGSSQMRELSNCCHVFHRECLDRWVDEGRLTCPLCRSSLLPPNISPWLVLRSDNISSTPTAQEQEQMKSSAVLEQQNNSD